MTLQNWSKKCSKGMNVMLDHLSWILSFFKFCATSRIEAGRRRTPDRIDLIFGGRYRIFPRIAPTSTKKSYLEKKTPKQFRYRTPKTVWSTDGCYGHTVHANGMNFFFWLGFFPYFAMVYGFAAISRFLAELMARPSTTGPQTSRRHCAKTIGWILTSRIHKLVGPRRLQTHLTILVRWSYRLQKNRYAFCRFRPKWRSGRSLTVRGANAHFF